MEKKAVWITIIVLLVLFILQIPFNFHNNAYYYATHIHHEKNQYPFVVLLNSNYLPRSYVSDYGVENDDKRGSYMVRISKKRIHTNYDIIDLTDSSILYSSNYNDESYYLNDCAKFTFAENGMIDGYYREGVPPKNAKKVLRHSLNRIQAEIKQNSEKPLINIQWLWNIWFSMHYR